MKQHSHTNTMAGFTLIELMISLVLGLLISAAVIQVYIINTRTITVQQSASEVQDSTIFAMQALEENIRLANLGNDITSITSTTLHGGVVLKGDNIGNADVSTGYLTVSAGQTGTADTNGWTGASNMNKDSDQLTIQYQNTTGTTMYDCEGTKIDSSSNWVIERYFVRLDTSATAKTGVQDLVLACDAGRVTDAGVLSNFGDKGEVMIPAVDQFKVLLGATDGDKLTYLPAKLYVNEDLTEKPAITTIKLGVVIRSNTPLLSSEDNEEFTLLDEDHTLKEDDARKKYYRRAYESTVLLRNARVMSVVETIISSS